MSKSIKSPLRYPGGKQKIVSKLFPLAPKNIIEYREPFLGGGSVFLHFKQQENEIKHWWINDGYQPVANFWQQVANCPDDTIKMIRALMKDHPDGKDLHKTLRRLYKEFHDALYLDATFLRCSATHCIINIAICLSVTNFVWNCWVSLLISSGSFVTFSCFCSSSIPLNC